MFVRPYLRDLRALEVDILPHISNLSIHSTGRYGGGVIADRPLNWLTEYYNSTTQSKDGRR